MAKQSHKKIEDRLFRPARAPPTHVLEADPSRGPLRTRAVSGVAHNRVARRCVFTSPTFPARVASVTGAGAGAGDAICGPPIRDPRLDLHGALGWKISDRADGARVRSRGAGGSSARALPRRAARVARRAARPARRVRPIGVARSPDAYHGKRVVRSNPRITIDRPRRPFHVPRADRRFSFQFRFSVRHPHAPPSASRRRKTERARHHVKALAKMFEPVLRAWRSGTRASSARSCPSTGCGTTTCWTRR